MKKNLFLLFVMTELILYTLILLSDFTGFFPGIRTPYLKITAILLCLAASCSFMISALPSNSSAPRTFSTQLLPVMTLSFLLSCTADYFLLFNLHFLIGVLCFIGVQFCYCKILGQNSFYLVLGGALLSSSFHIISSMLGIQTDAVACLSVFYLGCLIINIAASWTSHSGWLSTGITLLLVCDIHVGLANLYRYITLSTTGLVELWLSNASTLIWMFYIPAQICILIANKKTCPFSLSKNKQTILNS